MLPCVIVVVETKLEISLSLWISSSKPLHINLNIEYLYSSFINPSQRFLSPPPPPPPPAAAHNAHAAERQDRQRILLNQVTSLAPSSQLIFVAISAFFFLAVPFSNSQLSTLLYCSLIHS